MWQIVTKNLVHFADNDSITDDELKAMWSVLTEEQKRDFGRFFGAIGPPPPPEAFKSNKEDLSSEEKHTPSTTTPHANPVPSIIDKAVGAAIPKTLDVSSRDAPSPRDPEAVGKDDAKKDKDVEKREKKKESKEVVREEVRVKESSLPPRTVTPTDSTVDSTSKASSSSTSSSSHATQYSSLSLPPNFICAVFMNLDDASLYQAAKVAVSWRHAAERVAQDDLPSEFRPRYDSMGRPALLPPRRVMMGGTPLHGASTNGNHEICRALLDYGSDPNASDSILRTPLHWAAYNGHIKTALVLLQGGSDPELRDKYGSTALQLAKQEGHKEMVKVLIDQKGNLKAIEEYQSRVAINTIKTMTNYWDDFKNVEKEIRDFAKELGTPHLMPSQDQVVKRRMSDLDNAVRRRYGKLLVSMVGICVFEIIVTDLIIFHTFVD
jgi:hypothetical protein